MRDLAFYNVGCQPAKGPKRAMILTRRFLRRVLRPIFQRQVEILTHLCDRLDTEEHASRQLRANLDQLAIQTQATIAFGWDYVAMSRRLATLEEQVEFLSAQLNARSDDEAHLSLRFPRLDADGSDADSTADHDSSDRPVGVRSKVC